MSLSGSSGQYAGAGHIEADGKDEGKPSALVKLEGRILDMPEAAAPDAFARKVEETRLPPVPQSVFRTPSRDSLKIAEAQKAIKACHIRPKNMVSGSIGTLSLQRMLLCAVPQNL